MMANRALKTVITKKYPLNRALSTTAFNFNPEQFAKHPSTQVTTLNNGIRVATERVPGEAATIGVWINTGSRYEKENENGVAHFLEHLFFKGTKNRSQLQIEKECENMGAHLNAYTSREQTAYYASSLKKDAKASLETLADLLQNSKFTQASVENERGVILREMEEVHKLHDEIALDHLHYAAYRKCSLGRTILGTSEAINSIQPQDLKDFVENHYTGKRLVVCCAGDIDHSSVVQWTNELFSSIPAEPRKPELAIKEPAKFLGTEYRYREDDLPDAHIAIAYQTEGWDSPDDFALQVAQGMIGGFNSDDIWPNYSGSSLARRMTSAGSDPLAKLVKPIRVLYSDTGLFGLYAVSSAYTTHDLYVELVGEMVKLSYEIDEFDFAFSKKQLISSAFSQMDSTTNICDDIGRQMLAYNRRLHPYEIASKIADVTPADVKAVMDKYIYDQDHALAAHGQIYELPDYNYIRSETFRKFE